MPERKPKPSSKPEEEKVQKKKVIVDKDVKASENVVAVDTER